MVAHLARRLSSVMPAPHKKFVVGCAKWVGGIAALRSSADWSQTLVGAKHLVSAVRCQRTVVGLLPSGWGFCRIRVGGGTSQAVRQRCRYSGPWTEPSCAFTSNAWMQPCQHCVHPVLTAATFGKPLPAWPLPSREGLFRTRTRSSLAVEPRKSCPGTGWKT